MINNTKVMQRSDLPFIGITQEEALYYFNGEKSIEETAAAIRNKIDEMPNATNAQIDMDVVINIGDFSVSLYEGEQEILGKLDKMGLLYEKVEDSDNKKYDYYYNVGDGEAQFIQVYFLEKECVMKHLHIPREAYIPEILILKWSNNMEILMKNILI